MSKSSSSTSLMGKKRLARETSPKATAAGRSTPWHRHPFFLTMLSGIALLVLASAVYTVALRARELSTTAQQAHGLNETLRVASAVRSDLLLANGYRTIDGAGYDATQALDQTLQNASTGAASLRTALSDPDVAPFAAITERGEGFVDAAESHIAAIQNTPSGLDILPSQEPLDSSFAELFTRLSAQRTETLAKMESINETMNRVGSTAGYGVAFLVPAIALYVFEALRRTRLRARLGEQEVERLNLRIRRGATANAKQLDALSNDLRALINDPAVQENPNAAVRASRLMSGIAGLSNRALSGGALVTTQIAPVHLSSVIEGAVRDSRLTGVEVHTALQDQVVEGDEGHLHHILVELLRNAEVHGGDDIRVTAYQWEDSLTLSVLDNGPGLSGETERAVFVEDDLGLRRRLLDGDFGSGLLAARSRAEAMGATLDYDRTGGLTQITVRMQLNPTSPRTKAPANIAPVPAA